RPKLLYNPSGKEKRIRGGENSPPALYEKSHTSCGIFEPAGFVLQVILPASSLNVFIVRATLKQQVARGLNLSSIGIVSSVVCMNYVSAVIDFYFAAKLIDVAIFFLLDRFDSDRDPGLAGRRIRERLCRICIRTQLAGN